MSDKGQVIIYFREISFWPLLIPLLIYAYIKNKIQLIQKQLYAFYDFARFLIEKLGPTIKGMKSSLEAMRQMEGGGKD